MAVEKVGLLAVVENAKNFLRDADLVQKAQNKIGESAKKAAKDSGSLDTALKARQNILKQTGDLVSKFGPQGQAVAGVLEKVAASVSTVGVAAVAAAAAVALLAAGFVALAVRGAGIRGLTDSFDRLTASVGIAAEVMLKDLRAAAAGTVSDLELIRISNVALAGATGQVGKAIGESLPKLLEIARVQARATGQDVDYLFQSLITGVKRSSPLLIDNTGLVLKVGEANQKYADSIGKSVSELTAQEQQIALLNATLEAGQVAIDTLGNSQETAAEKIARANAHVTNILDTLALAIQPIFEAILDKINQVLAGIEAFVRGAAPYITAIAQLVGDLIGGLNINLGPAGDLPKVLFEGAARSFGAYARGIVEAANRFIFPTVIRILETLSSWLIGASPPPAGPLADIDGGGQSTMLAWLGGFTGVSLEPVEQVAAQVAAALGNIGQFNQRQVESRLAMLDAALKPFQNRLEIVKADFEAIAAPAQAALDAIDRQIDTALNALGQGDQRAAETIRMLDRQREAVQGFVSSQQGIVDHAQIQLALATAQQGRERALLNIRKAMFAVIQKTARRQGSGGVRVDRPATGTGEAPPTEVPAAGVGLPPDAFSSVQELFGTGPEAVAGALAGLEDAFAEGVGEENLAEFQSNIGKVNQLVGTLNAGDIGGKIRDQFKPVADIFDPGNPDSPAGIIKAHVESLFGTGDFSISSIMGNISLDATAETIRVALKPVTDLFNTEEPGSPAATIKNLIDSLFGSGEFSIPNLIGDINLEASIQLVKDALKPITNLFNPAEKSSPAATVQRLLNSLLDPNTEGSIPYRIGRLGVEVINKGVQIRADIQGAFDAIFSLDNENSVASKVKNLVSKMVDPADPDSIPAFFASLPERIKTAVADLGSTIETSIINPVKAFLTGEGAEEGAFTLPSLIDRAVGFFAGLPDRIVNVLKGFGLTVFTVLVKPIEGVLNTLIGLFEDALKGLVQGAIDAVGSIIGGLSQAGIDPGFFRQIQDALRDAQAGISFDRVNLAVPDFLTNVIPDAAGTSYSSTTNNNYTGNFYGIQNVENAYGQFARMSAG